MHLVILNSWRMQLRTINPAIKISTYISQISNCTKTMKVLHCVSTFLISITKNLHRYQWRTTLSTQPFLCHISVSCFFSWWYSHAKEKAIFSIQKIPLTYSQNLLSANFFYKFLMVSFARYTFCISTPKCILLGGISPKTSDIYIGASLFGVTF